MQVVIAQETVLYHQYPQYISPIVSPLDSQNSSGVSCFTPTLNPLVRAGLIPPHLVDLLTTPPATKEPTKRITGARDLTANEYYEWLQEEEQKKKEAAEAKQKRIEERQRKKEEMEEQRQRKQEDKEKKKQLAEGHAKKQTATTSSVCRKLPMQEE